MAPFALVRTVKSAYLGYVKEDDRRLYLERAAEIPEGMTEVRDLALEYFSEKARRRLGSYEIPLSAVVEKRIDDEVERMVAVYAELSRAANKQVAGRIKIARLKKFLGE